MLQAKEKAEDRVVPRGTRALIALLLVGVTLGVSALRGQPRGAPASREQPAKAALKRLPEFDLTYVDGCCNGVVAFRPAALLNRPGMKAHAAALNRDVSQLCRALGFPAGLGLPVEAIDQLTAGIELRSLERGQTGFLLHGPIIRAARPFDWNQRVRKLVPGATRVSYAGKVYYRLPRGKLPLLGPRVCFFIPDDRTLVFRPDEKDLRRLLRHKDRQPPPFARTRGWKRVEHSLFALAVDNRDKGWARNLLREKDDASSVLPLIKRTNLVTLGMESGRRCVLRAFAECADERGAREVARVSAQGLRQVRGSLGRHRLPREAGPEIIDLFESVKDLFRQARVGRRGKTVRVESRFRLDLGQLVRLMAEGRM
jgi:hypothetical protein